METRLLLCTHRVAFGQLLADWLRSTARATQVTGLPTGRQILEFVRSRKTDLALLDPGHPDEDMFELTASIRRISPRTEVIFVADSAPMGWVYRSLRAGASAFLGKDATLDDLSRAIQAVRIGHRFFTTGVARVVSDLAIGAPHVPMLTERELAVLRLMCDGRSTKEISSTLELGPKTIDAIRSRLMKKTGTRRATDLVRFACEERYIDLRPNQGSRPVRGAHEHPAPMRSAGLRKK